MERIENTNKNRPTSEKIANYIKHKQEFIPDHAKPTGPETSDDATVYISEKDFKEMIMGDF